MHLLTSIRNNRYYQDNKVVILLLFAWMFRLCFLTQRNDGGISINKYVLLQIVLMIGLFFKLYQLKVYPWCLLSYTSTKWFAFIYLFGMISIFWSVMPLMSCYFAFENLVCLTALFHLAHKCQDKYQLERVFIVMTVFILVLFLLRVLTGGTDLHSVTFSSIAAILATYCLGEYGTKGRPEENRKVVKYGLIIGVGMLVLTTSGGAILSVAISLFALALFAEKSSIRFLALLCISALAIMWYSGATDMVLDIIFPGKEIESMDDVMAGHGRDTIWRMIGEKIDERPWFGWGFAAVERVLPIYCTDAHNSIVGIRGSLGNVGCGCLVVAMLSQLLYLYRHTHLFGFRGLFVATVCAFINSNTTNLLAAKANESSLVFLFTLVLGVAYLKFSRQDVKTR